jgi:hypothetical protein
MQGLAESSGVRLQENRLNEILQREKNREHFRERTLLDFPIFRARHGISISFGFSDRVDCRFCALCNLRTTSRIGFSFTPPLFTVAL